MNPNRKIAPQLKPLTEFALLKPKKLVLPNGMPLYMLNCGTQDILKIELIFDAGTTYQQKKLIAHFANKMLSEGTKKYSSLQIAETLDYYGAFTELGCEKDTASFVCYCLPKHLSKIMPVMEEIIKHPVFPEKELDIQCKNQRQQFLVNYDKVNFKARLHFNALIYGDTHPYGMFAQADDYNNVQKNELIEFHQHFYVPKNCKILISGKISDDVIEHISNVFGDNNWNTITPPTSDFAFPAIFPKPTKQYIPKENAMQSAVRIGRVMFNRNHPDYLLFQVLNTILGGYFGSRLMTNIREDKGLTYGIGSAIVSLNHSGYFFITSEVNAENIHIAVQEIYKEIEKLQQDKVSQEELDLVKNYLSGTFLRSTDGPLALSELFKTLIANNIDLNYYENYLTTIQHITAEQIRDTAQKYLQLMQLSELIVGAK